MLHDLDLKQKSGASKVGQSGEAMRKFTFTGTMTGDKYLSQAANFELFGLIYGTVAPDRHTTFAKATRHHGRIYRYCQMSASQPSPRRIALVLASTDHGTMIINRFDHHTDMNGKGFGVGFKILNESSHELGEISVAAFVLESRERLFGDGVVVVDCGANIGTHTVSWARQMTGWGSVIAIEAQERIYYALAGNVAINNCFNVRAVHAAVGDKNGTVKIPTLDYFTPASFGSLELKPARRPEEIGQAIDYSDANLVSVPAVMIDALGLDRLDLLKIDVEGMEFEVLEGAKRIIRRSLPVIVVEHLKSGTDEIVRFLKHYGYHMAELGLNILAIHPSDKTSEAFGPQSQFRVY